MQSWDFIIKERGATEALVGLLTRAVTDDNSQVMKYLLLKMHTRVFILYPPPRIPLLRRQLQYSSWFVSERVLHGARRTGPSGRLVTPPAH